MRKYLRAVLARLTTPLWPAAVAGIALGAVIGGTALHSTETVEVDALVRIFQPIDPSQIMVSGSASPEEQQSYISGEIAYLTSPGFADSVAKQLNETARPALSAVQDTQSPVVTLSSTAPDAESATRAVDAAVFVYSEHVLQQSRARGQAAIDAINNVIAQLTPPPPVPNEYGWVPEAEAPSPELLAQIQQLELQRQAIQVQMQRPAGVQIIQVPTEAEDSGAPMWALGALAGGLAGGLIAMAGGLAWRRRAGVVHTPSALDELADSVLVPVVRLNTLVANSDSHIKLARLLYAQLPPTDSGSILVVGASTGSGTRDVARLIAAAAGERGLTRTITLADNLSATYDDSLDHGLQQLLMSSATTIIDGGSLGDSATLPDAAAGARQIIVVVRVGHDVADSVRTAAQLARHNNIPITAVCTRAGLVPNFRRGDAPHRHSLDNAKSPVLQVN
ncbi:GumC domain-containing protein [Mycobacterium hippophais]|nr:hypothetical protein [Mycobacterium hippophais]